MRKLRMRTDDVTAVADLLGDLAEVVVDTTRDVHRAVAARVFRGVEKGVGPAAMPPRMMHDGVAETVYATVRTTLTSLVRGAGRLAALTRPGTSPALADSPRGAAVVAAVNGLWGDRLAEHGSVLDLGIGLRHNGTDLATSPEALANAYPDATPRVAVFLHGLCENETAWWLHAETWHPTDPPTHGHRLQSDLGFTPLWVRFNTGRHVSVIGRDLDALLSGVDDAWPVPVEEIAIIGHSMGGLIARSALHQAATRGAGWAGRVRHVICLGTPHHGAALEKVVNAAAWALEQVGESRPFAAILNRRSVGIKDMRYGNVSDEDWRDHHPDALLTDTRTGDALVDGVRYHVIGARVGPGPVGSLVGDGVVRLPSATGRNRRWPLPFDRTIELGEGMHHLELLNHPVVYDHIRDSLQ
jgi:pimeloyl-ACP methyl ester carboxylesterase